MKCIETISHPKIKVSDPGTGKRAILLNENRENVRRIRMDGCLSPIGKPSADFIVSAQGKVDVIIELKGSNIDRAVIQVEATRLFWEAHEERTQGQNMGSWILCSEFPRASTKIDRYRNVFRKRSAVLVVSTHNGEERSFSQFCPKRT